MRCRFAELAIELGGFGARAEDLLDGCRCAELGDVVRLRVADARIACASYRARGEYVPKRDVAREQELLLLGNGLRTSASNTAASTFQKRFCG